MPSSGCLSSLLVEEVGVLLDLAIVAELALRLVTSLPCAVPLTWSLGLDQGSILIVVLLGEQLQLALQLVGSLLLG